MAAICRHILPALLGTNMSISFSTSVILYADHIDNLPILNNNLSVEDADGNGDGDGDGDGDGNSAFGDSEIVDSNSNYAKP